MPEPLALNVQDWVASPLLLHRPDQIAPCPSSVVSVIDVPLVKLADPELPLDTFKPAGLEVTLPPLPVATRVTVTLAVHGPPQVSVPPHPSRMLPQVLP